MHLIFMDESGDISFSTTSESKYFTITCLTINEVDEKKINNTIKNKKVKLYNLGWPRQIEMKANTLHVMKYIRKIPASVKSVINGDDYILEILKSVRNSCQLRIDYIVVNKDRIKKPSLRNAEYGIAYNFFSWKLLRPMITHLKSCKLIVDPRNKELHSKKHFEGYIETEALKLAMSSRIAISFDIEQPNSHVRLGLQAVDFFSWSVNRLNINKSRRFYDVFRDLVVLKFRWYC